MKEIILLFIGICGLFTALSKKLIYAAFSLFLCLSGIAALYLYCNAELIAAAQIILYVGGVLVLIIFGIMLSKKGSGDQTEGLLGNPIISILLVLFLAFILYIGYTPEIKQSVTTNSDFTKNIGQLTVTKFLLPFELISFFLLAALVGASYMSRRKPAMPRKINLEEKK
jgi:NADH-quinone oxidoreductase subunit J